MFPYNSSPQINPWQEPTMLYQSTLNPYDDQNFLISVFNYNPQSIQAFQSLTHEDKLKFYLSVEQMKLLGYMNDRIGYEKILKEIARRVMIIKKPDLSQVNKKQEGNVWGSKLQHLLDDHLKKIQKDNFLDDLPIDIIQKNHVMPQTIDLMTGGSDKKVQKNEQQQFEWAQPDPIQNKENFSKQQGKVSKNNEMDWNVGGLNYQGLQNKQSNVGYQQNYNSFDLYHQNQTVSKAGSLPISKIQNAQIKHTESIQSMPVPKQQIIDVWDLQVIPEQPDKLKKIIHQNVMSQPKIPLQQKYSNHAAEQIKKQQAKQQQFDPFSMITDNQYNSLSANIIGFSTPNTHTQGQKNYNSLKNVQHSTLQQPFIINVQNNKLEIIQQSTVNQNISRMANQGTTITTQNKTNNEDQQFQWQDSTVAQPETPNPIFNITNISNNAQNIDTHIQQQSSKVQHANTDEFNFLGAQQIQYPNHTYSDQLFQIPHNFHNNAQNNHTNLTSGTATQSVLDLQTSFGFDLKSFQNSYSVGELSHNTPMIQSANYNDVPVNNFMKKKVQDEIQQNDDYMGTSTMRSSTILQTIDLKVLQPLKRFPPTSTIVLALKKKIFDFDREFYNEALNLISGLGYSQNPDYFYIKDQSSICNEIFNLTERYTMAVDEDQQQQVMQNLKICKSLYTQLDTPKTVKILKKYLKMEGQSLSYQVGRLSLQAGVPKQLIQRAIKDKNFTQIATMLYLMVYLGNTYSIATYASQVIQYVQQAYSQLQKIAQQVTALPQQCKTIIKANKNFQQYKQNVGEVARITKRVIQIATLCSKQQLCNNLNEFMQKLNGMFNRNRKIDQNIIIPNYFLTFFSQFACSSCNNIYTLHSQMNQFIQQHPICALCLYHLQHDEHQSYNGGAKRDDGNFYHFKCWNFKVEVTKYKNNQMEASRVF